MRIYHCLCGRLSYLLLAIFKSLKTNTMKKLVLILMFIPLVSLGQSFELTNAQSMCMIGKGEGQDATINPYADEDYSYALIENIGLVKFQIRIESSEKDIKQFLIESNNIIVVKLNKNDVLYFDALTFEKAEVKIKYTLDEGELPPPPPPVHKTKSSAYPLH